MLSNRVILFVLIAAAMLGVNFFSGQDRNYLRVTGYYSNNKHTSGTASDTLLVIPATTMDGRQTYRQMAVYGRVVFDTLTVSTADGDSLIMKFKPFYGDSAIWWAGDGVNYAHIQDAAFSNTLYFSDTLNIPVCDSVLFIITQGSGASATDSVISKNISWRLYNPDE